MNRDLAKYILTLKEEISLRIWLSAISQAARNGTANLKYKDLTIDHHLTKVEIDKYFKPFQAHNLNIITVLVATENFISINFKKGNKQQATPHQLKQVQSPALLQISDGKKTAELSSDNLPALVNNKPVPKGFIQQLPKTGYVPSTVLIKAIIGDYIRFFQQLQIDKAALIGKDMNVNETATPNINGEDVKHFKNIAIHFSRQPGVINEDQIKRLFGRIYQNWWSLTNFIKDYSEPRHIDKNINRIITEIQTLNNNNGKTSDKKENEFNQKVNKARSKDYSKLAQARKKDD
jgi:hypothetical protein